MEQAAAKVQKHVLVCCRSSSEQYADDRGRRGRGRGGNRWSGERYTNTGIVFITLLFLYYYYYYTKQFI